MLAFHRLPWPPAPKLSFSHVRKLLIIRHDRIGDVVLTLPLASVVKASHPDIAVHFLLRAYTAPLARHHPHVDQVVVLPDDLRQPEAYAGIRQVLSRENYDLAIVVHSTADLARLVWDARIPHRMGNALRLHSWRYNLRVYQRRRQPRKHELDHNLDLIRPYVPVPPRDKIDLGLRFGPEAERAAARFLAERGIGRFLIVHPGSGGSAVDLPPETMAAWIDSYPYAGSIIVTGDDREASLYQTLAARTAKPLVNAVGLLSLEELVALIARCELFLSNSTGPLHIARALGRPLLGFYCTIPACHPRRWGPYNQEETHTLLPPGESFGSCQPDQKKCAQAMSQVTPGMITEKLREILGPPAAAEASSPPAAIVRPP